MFKRYGVYVVPTGDLGAFGAEWLGWDVVTGKQVGEPGPLVATPHKYGFHGTIKAPFRLANGQTAEALTDEATRLCAGLSSVTVPLKVARLGSFIALVPDEDQTDLRTMAMAAMTGLDDFRDPLTEADLTRRRAAGLTPAQDALLLQWGYPYVMDEFRFHLTLTGRVDDPDPVRDMLAERLEPLLTEPLVINDLALVGEAEDGRFHQVTRLPLG